MRAEMLNRLDAFLAGELYGAAWEVWQKTLRAELAAERCEHCSHWGAVTHECRGVEDAKFSVLWWADGNAEEGGAQLETEPDFCCSHFTKKQGA